MMKPVIAVVGRPNVGKSTLFNRMTKSRDAIVADFAGLTRDRHYGDGRHGGREFIVVDTGGFEPDSTGGIVARDGQADPPGGRRGRCGGLRRRRARRTLRAGPRHRALPALGQQEGVPRRQQGRRHVRVAAARRVLRTRHGRAASGLGGARAGRAQPARRGAGGFPGRGRGRRRRRGGPSATSRSGSPWPGGPTSASRR